MAAVAAVAGVSLTEFLSKFRSQLPSTLHFTTTPHPFLSPNAALSTVYRAAAHLATAAPVDCTLELPRVVTR